MLIIAAAGLSHEFEIEGLRAEPIRSVFPSVTCTVQASFRTASPPAGHGMIANGLFFRDLNRPMFWEQSAALVRGERIWRTFRDSGKKVGMLFWQQSLGEQVDVLLSPAPIHKHGGGMIQDCYSRPKGLYKKLREKIGRPFKLRGYWGPLASRRIGEWIVDATEAVLADPDTAPDLCMTYLPTLDYDLQRYGPGKPPVEKSARAFESQLARLVRRGRGLDYEILVFGDYRIGPVEGAVFPNLALREAGLVETRQVGRRKYLDFYKSRAFAMVDHEVAHVYVRDEKDVPCAKDALSGLSGAGEIIDSEKLPEVGLGHPNSGELVIVAAEGKWFAYPWWKQPREAPDFARHVDIHNKPGFDPCELFFGWPPGSVAADASRIRGSHGRVGPRRKTVWASSFPLPGEPADLIELSASVRRWLND